jgi:hypothetical protein
VCESERERARAQEGHFPTRTIAQLSIATVAHYSIDNSSSVVITDILHATQVTHADSTYVNIDMTPVIPGEKDAVVVDFGKKNME